MVYRIVGDAIKEGCLLENTLSGLGTIIIDKDFLNEMDIITNELKDEKDLIGLLTKIYNKVIEYFSSNELNEKSREQTYVSNEVVDEDGMIIGTKISSLKGKDISRYSEKSIAAYIILEKLHSKGFISRQPLLTLSQLFVES